MKILVMYEKTRRNGFYRLVMLMTILMAILTSSDALAEGNKKDALIERMEALERRLERLETGSAIEHRHMMEEMRRHIDTLQRRLEKIDYRTVRLRAIEERTDSFSMGGGLTIFLQGVYGTAGVASGVEGSYSADLFFVAPAGNNGNVYFRANTGQGEGVTTGLPEMFAGPNADLELNRAEVELVEVWYRVEFPLLDRTRRLELVAGKLDPTAFFDTNDVANSETEQFMADMFVNNPAIEFGGDANGYGAGVVADYHCFTGKRFDITTRLGLFEGDGDFRDILDEPFVIWEVDLHSKEEDRGGNYRFYVWLNGMDHRDILDPDRTGLTNKGVGVSIDQMVSEGLNLFLRAGYQRDDVSSFDYTFSFGGELSGTWFLREADALAMAYGLLHTSPALRKSGGADRRFEHHMELYYRYTINDNIALTSDIQYVMNPGGNSRHAPMLLYAMRVQLSF